MKLAIFTFIIYVLGILTGVFWMAGAFLSVPYAMPIAIGMVIGMLICLIAMGGFSNGGGRQ